MASENRIESDANFELTVDRLRREWAETGADYAWQILKFLQGRRLNEISLAEVERTKTYERSAELEKSALRFVASQSERRYPLNDEDRRRLRERDNFLMEYVDGSALGYRDWVNEIGNVPRAVAHAQAVDASLFPVTFPSTRLFDWIWEAR